MLQVQLCFLFLTLTPSKGFATIHDQAPTNVGKLSSIICILKDWHIETKRRSYDNMRIHTYELRSRQSEHVLLVGSQPIPGMHDTCALHMI